MSDTIGVIDLGIGNVGSVANMCRRLGAAPTLIERPDDITTADRLIFPGVGAWDPACEKLRDSGMGDAIVERVRTGTPLLGICLGMQLLLDSSDEGTLPGLGLIPGEVSRLPTSTARGEVRIPHMGWRRIDPTQAHLLSTGLQSDARYYFVHSYAAVPTDPDHVLATAEYGDRFVAIVGRDQVVGTQFHPEKSHRHGKALMTAFLTDALVPA